MVKSKSMLENRVKSTKILPPKKLLKTARSFMGVSRKLLAQRMGITYETLQAYENGNRRIPNSILLKLYMFGIDFWIDNAVLDN